MRTFAFPNIFVLSETGGCRFCDDNQRLAIALHDPEHGFEYLHFVDPISGEILEDLVQPADWLAELPSEANNYTSYGEPYRGEILVCADGKRIIQQTPDRKGGWQWRHRTQKGWRDGPAIPTRLDDGSIPRKGWQTAWRSTSMVASADGGTVVVSGVLHGDRGYRPSRRYNRSLDEIAAEQYVREFEAEVWSIDKRGKVALRAPIPPVQLRDKADPIVAVSSGPKPLIAVPLEGNVVVRNLSGDEVASLKMPAPPKPSRASRKEPKHALRFSDDGQRLVGHFGNVVLAWDTTNWKKTSIRLASKSAMLVAVSPRGDSVAIAGQGGVVRFFDAATGAPGTAITPPQVTASATRTGDTPVALCFSSDGTMCLLGLANGSIAIWDLD